MRVAPPLTDLLKRLLEIPSSLVFRLSSSSSREIRLLQNSTGDGELGSRQWSSGLLLAAYLEHCSFSFAHQHVLELGCGLGLPAMVLAAANETTRVTLTDKQELEELAK